MPILCEDLIGLLRQNLIEKRKSLTHIPLIKETYKGVYLFYILNNIKCCSYEKDTISLLLSTKRFDHPLYHSILSASNNNYTFFDGSRDDRRDVEISTFDCSDQKKKFERSCPKVAFYLEETECLFWQDDIKRKEHIKKIYDLEHFIGSLSHISETVKYLNNAFNTSKNQYVSLPSIDFKFSHKYFDRSIDEEEVIVFSPNSWKNGSEGQCRGRGLHVLDRAFVIAKEKCPGLKLLLTNPAKQMSLQSVLLYPSDVSIIRGDIDHNTMHYLYSSADINVLPSLRVHAHTLLTSISVGHACVGTDTFGFNDFVSDNGVLLTPPIVGTKAYEDYGFVTQSENCVKYANDFDSINGSAKFVDQIAEQLIDLYNNRKKLRDMRYNSYKKNITEFSFEKHQETLYNFVSGRG
jgi:glycosyltransferase involved in cell wall biosynthesis